MSPSRTQLRYGLWAGARRGGRSFVWICKILIPTSFLVIFVQWSGLLNQAAPFLDPLMRLINLPGEAALPIISGLLIGPYTTIPIVTVIPFSIEQITLIAVFTMIAHSLVIEGIIQHKSGINAAKIILIRIACAVLTVLIVSQFLGDTTKSVVIPAYLAITTPFIEVIKVWATATIELLIKLLVIIMAVMIGLESLKSMGRTEYLLKIFNPVMRIMGLSNRTALLWVTAVIFGLMYSGAVIIEEAKKGILTKEELERLHISVGINHSMAEEPSMWLALGVSGFWLWIPRFITAVTAVQVYRGIQYLRGKSFPKQMVRSQ